jgi:uncharacterized membrane protein
MWTAFAGRFHPLIVHLPIGFLLLAFLFEVISVFKKYRKLRFAVEPTLLLGTVFAWLSCLTGYWLRQEGGYEDRIVDVHKYLGLSTAALATITIFIRSRATIFFSNPRVRKKVFIIAFIPLIILLSLTGHWGGSLTHGEDYLSFSLDELSIIGDPGKRVRAVSNLDSAVLYNDVIQPLFDARCVSCHSSKKQKGELRLDGKQFILKGGKTGALFEEGNPDSSLLYKRIVLPLEDKHHMPPHERPQLTSAEVNLVQSWIKDGCNFSKSIQEYLDAENVKKYLAHYLVPPLPSIVPAENATSPDEKAMAELRSHGVLILPASESSNYLVINFTNSRNVTDVMLSSLIRLADQTLSVNLNFTSTTDRQLSILSQLKNLRLLHLNNTSISNAGVDALRALPELKILSLVNTKVTDEILTKISEMKNLRKIYLFNTSVTRQGIEAFIRQNKQVEIDTGNYQLPSLTTDTLVYKRKKI